MKFKALIITAAVIVAAGGSVYAAELISSPDGSVTAELSFDSGNISYTAAKNGTAVLAPSPLGIRFEDADFTENVSFVSREDNYIDESYETISGKTKHRINKANEAVFTLWKDGRELKLYVRAYNDGIAVRYGYDNATLAYGETTAYNFAGGDHKVWAQVHEHAYENYYKPNTLMGLNDSYGMPLTIQINDSLYAMMTEAELNGSYAGAVLKADGTGSLKIEYEKTQEGAVEISSDFLSPWRVTVMGTISDIAETYLPENLCKPSQLSDTSWIKPGVSSWTWFNGDPTNDPEVYKQYIDFSAEMGWNYVLLDEGWQPLDHETDGKKSYSGIQSWTKDVIDYAASKNIGVFVWSTSWDLDTPEKRTRLREWAEMGIKGVKVDFFDSESQKTLQLYDAITEETARLKLMVNYHGCNKPTGENRTWPHIITREAVQGTEHFRSYGDWGATAEHNTILPFTRNAIGSMDFTPAITNYNNRNYYTIGHKAALPIMFESGIQCMSDKPSNYRNTAVYELYKNLPAAWDESRLLGGIPGSFAMMYRRSGDTIYVAIIGNEKRTIELQTDFIDNTMQAELFLDGADENSLTVTREILNKNDIITIPLSEHGGALIKLTPDNGISGIDSHWCRDIVSEMNNNGQLCGYFAADFKPDALITRGEFVMMLAVALNINTPSQTPQFTDSIDHRAKNYIAAAVNQGIINGVSETKFAPDSYITREQAATIIGRYLELASGINIPFTDKDDVSDYAKMYVSACASKDIINGYDDGSFLPKANITRAETAAILSRVAKK